MENNSELGIINHLLSIEKDASSLINDAQIESEKRVAEARNKYNAEYKDRYEKTVKALEENYQKELEQVKESHDKEIQEYISSLESSEKNTKVFNEVLDKVLFA